MNKDRIIELAKKAQIATSVVYLWHDDIQIKYIHDFLERFANHVAAETREECAALCDEVYMAGRINGAQDCAAAIRGMK